MEWIIADNYSAKTEKQLQELKEMVEALEKKLAELSDDELDVVSGGLKLIRP